MEVGTVNCESEGRSLLHPKISWLHLRTRARGGPVSLERTVYANGYNATFINGESFWHTSTCVSGWQRSNAPEN
jgi:hypothetical protein